MSNHIRKANLAINQQVESSILKLNHDMKNLLERNVEHSTQIKELFELVKYSATKAELHAATSSVVRSMTRPESATAIENIQKSKFKGLFAFDVDVEPAVKNNSSSYQRPATGIKYFIVVQCLNSN